MRKSIHSPKHSEFCATLAAIRKKKGITQIQLAKRLARPQSFVAKVENGERRLDVLEFIAYAAALGADAAALVKKLTRE